jgi:hypothetical protein
VEPLTTICTEAVLRYVLSTVFMSVLANALWRVLGKLKIGNPMHGKMSESAT